MAEKLTQNTKGRILGPDGSPFDLDAHVLVMAKRYEEPVSNYGYSWMGLERVRRRLTDYDEVVERDAMKIAEANDIPYFLILSSETVRQVSEFGYPGDFKPRQLLDVKPTDIRIYTANFYAPLRLEARLMLVAPGREELVRQS